MAIRLDEIQETRQVFRLSDIPEEEFVGPTDIRPFFAGPGLEAPEFEGDVSKLPRRIVSPGGLDILGPQDFPTMEVRPPNRSRFRDAIDRAASGLASTASGLATGVAGALDISSQIPSPFMRPRGQVVKDVEKIKKSSEFLWEVSKDPALAAQNTDLLSKGLNLAAETVPYITATSIGVITAGPLGGFAVGSMVEGNSSYRTALDFGVPEDKAKRIGAMVGVAAGAIEAFGGRYASHLLEKVARKIVNKGVRTGAVFGVGTVIEALEEGSQEIAAITGEETYRDVSWKEATNRTLGSMAAGGFLGGTAKVGTSTVRGVPEAVGPETDIREQIPPISEAVDTSGLPPLETVPTGKPPQVPKELIVTPEKAKVEAPSKALKPPTREAKVVEKPVVQPAKPTPTEITPEPTITPVEGEVEVFRGDIEEGRPLKARISSPPDVRGIFFSTEEDTARLFADMSRPPGEKGVVEKFKVNLKNPASEAIENEVLEKLGAEKDEDSVFIYTPDLANDVADELISRGYDGIIREGAGEVIAFGTESITPPAKAEAKPVEKGEIDVKEEAITEPKPSIEEQQRKARPTVSLEPTGKLDPTNPEEAAKIVDEARKFNEGRDTPIALSGIYESKYDKGEIVITKVIYSHKQVDQAYRTLQTEIESPQDDVSLWAMPGKEKELGAIGQKMAKMKKLSEKKKVPSIGKARQLPRAKTKKQDFVKAIRVASATESERYAITGVSVEGNELIATDGRRIFVAKGKWGKDGLYLDKASISKGILGKVDKSGKKFPAWKDILPDYSKEQAIEISPNAINNDLPTVWRRLHQASVITTEESKGIIVILNKDGSLGFAASAPEVGHTEINVNPGGKILGAASPRFLMDALAFHTIRGDKSIDFYFPFPDRPILTIGPHGETKTITMPVTAGEPSVELKKELGISEEKPKPKGGGKVGSIGGDVGRIKVEIEPAGKVQTAAEIVTYIDRAFNIPLRGMATHRPRVFAGWFDPKAVGIRMKDVRSLTTAMHEIGHHIDWTLNNRLSKNPPNSDMASELMSLGKALYGSRTPSGGYKSEGFAEFIREYLTGDEAETKAPAVYKWFTEKFLSKNPGVSKKLDITKGMITKWRLQGAESRIESQISKKRPKGTMFERMVRASLWIEKSFRSELAPLRRAMRKIGIKEGDIIPADNPYQIAVARADKSGAIARFFVEENTTDLAGNVTGKGLKEILRPVAKDIKTFTQWIVAARARLLHKKGVNPGISKADANFVYEKYDNPQWQETLKEVTEWNHRILDYLVEAGGMEKKARDVIIATNPIYVPFMREFLEGEINVGQGIGRGVAKTGKPIKKIKGSGRAIIDPFESMIQQAAKVIGVAHKTQVAIALSKFAGKKGAARMIWKVPAPTQATQFQAEQLKKDIARIAFERMGMDPDEISSAMLEQWDEILTVYTNASHYFGKDNIISFSINGKRQFYEVEPELYRAIEGLDRYVMPRVLDLILGKPNRAVRLGATGLNAAFGLIRNSIRDALTFTVLAKHAKFGPLSAIKGIAEDIARTTGAQKFKAIGGKMSAQILADRQALQHLKKEILVTTVPGKVIYTVAHPVNALRELFGVSEAGTRIGEFVPALKAAEKKYGKGSMSAAIEALNAAQDVTTNFSRHGSIGKILNQMIPFFNAAIQGPDKIVRTFAERPKATSLKAIFGLTLPALLLWWRHKDDEWYKNMAVYERVNYLHFKIPGKDIIIRIPVPFELGHIFQSAPVAALDAKYRKDPKLVIEMFEESLDQANPLDWPATISPVVDVMANRDFAGRPIVPRGVEYKMPQDQYKRHTSRLMKVIGKAIGYSPAKLEHMVNNYSGGLFARVSKTIDLKNKKEITASDIPIIGTLFLREPYAPRAQLERFYTRRDELNRKYSSKNITQLESNIRKKLNSAAAKISEQLKKLPDAKTQGEKVRIYNNIKKQLRLLKAQGAN